MLYVFVPECVCVGTHRGSCGKRNVSVCVGATSKTKDSAGFYLADAIFCKLDCSSSSFVILKI